MALKASTMRTIRQWHLYVGLFFAPLLLLFSISGAIQTFRLPDPPSAPGWMKWMAAIHKDQELPHPKPPKPASKAAPKPAGAAQPDKRPNKLPLQMLVALLAIGLIVSTLLGVTIALNARATRRISLILLAAGSLVPLALLYL